MAPGPPSAPPPSFLSLSLRAPRLHRLLTTRRQFGRTYRLFPLPPGLLLRRRRPVLRARPRTLHRRACCGRRDAAVARSLAGSEQDARDAGAHARGGGDAAGGRANGDGRGTRRTGANEEDQAYARARVAVNPGAGYHSGDATYRIQTAASLGCILGCVTSSE